MDRPICYGVFGDVGQRGTWGIEEETMARSGIRKERLHLNG